MTSWDAGSGAEEELQHEVLTALADCHKHRRWYASFAVPYLGQHPIEVGSGLGDYAHEWLPYVERLTVTDSSLKSVALLASRFALHNNVVVRQLTLPSNQRSDHTSVISYNVLEHIPDHAAALHSMAGLARPGGYIIIISPAFPFAMSALDIRTGHVRRYTRRSMAEILAASGLQTISIRYINSFGLIGYYISAKLLRRHFLSRRFLILYDQIFVPLTRALETVCRQPPFGQSIVVIAQVPASGTQ
jgi:hypothetical protein